MTLIFSVFDKGDKCTTEIQSFISDNGWQKTTCYLWSVATGFCHLTWQPLLADFCSSSQLIKLMFDLEVA